MTAKNDFHYYLSFSSLSITNHTFVKAMLLFLLLYCSYSFRSIYVLCDLGHIQTHRKMFSRAKWHGPLLHKICIWTQIRKIKRKFIFNQSESRIKDLRLIFLICIQTQILCNGAYIETSDKTFTWYLEPSHVSLQENAAKVHSDAVCRCFFVAYCYTLAVCVNEG